MIKYKNTTYDKYIFFLYFRFRLQNYDFFLIFASLCPIFRKKNADFRRNLHFFSGLYCSTQFFHEFGTDERIQSAIAFLSPGSLIYRSIFFRVFALRNKSIIPLLVLLRARVCHDDFHPFRCFLEDVGVYHFSRTKGRVPVVSWVAMIDFFHALYRLMSVAVINLHASYDSFSDCSGHVINGS